MKYILSVIFLYFIARTEPVPQTRFYCYQHTINCDADGYGTVTDAKCYRSEVEIIDKKYLIITTDSTVLKLVKIGKPFLRREDPFNDKRLKNSYFAVVLGKPTQLYYITEIVDHGTYFFSANPTSFKNRGINNAVQITYSDKPLTLLCR